MRRWLEALQVRLANLVSRGVVRRVSDSDGMQTLQLEALAGETLGEVEHPHPYGLTSVPLDGAEVWIASIGGHRDQSVALAVSDRRYRITGLASGEVAVHNDAGARVVLRHSGDVEVTPGGTGKVKISADVEVTGTVTASVDVVGGGKHLASHVHGAGTYAVVSAPGPVTPGTVSGAPT
jgi:phage gp45-like